MSDPMNLRELRDLFAEAEQVLNPPAPSLGDIQLRAAARRRAHRTKLVSFAIAATAAAAVAAVVAFVNMSGTPTAHKQQPATSPTNPVPPAPVIADFLPATDRITSTTRIDLDGSGIPQIAVAALGSVQDAGNTGFAPSTVLLLRWDPAQRRWTVAFDASKEPSYLSAPQLGSDAPGLSYEGARVAVVHDQPGGGADLLYVVDSIAGNSGSLKVGLVHFADGVATLAYSYAGDEGHLDASGFDVPTTETPGATVIGSAPAQQVKITLPWLTDVDSRSQAARMYSFVVASDSRGGYRIASDDRSYVGVGVTSTSSNQARVGWIDPASPAAAVLRLGDVIEGVIGSKLTPVAAGNVHGPVVIEQVAILYPGDTVTLQVIRGGQTRQIQVTLGARNKRTGPPPASAPLPM